MSIFYKGLLLNKYFINIQMHREVIESQCSERYKLLIMSGLAMMPHGCSFIEDYFCLFRTHQHPS